ncbi:hypothetical protein C1645_827084 [Glomus cerebriforme]|uniref:Galactose oxidase n=1 Tax=Glomus cerebriforme TaxID=658196 RepID=A0A397SP61_9GLOM|nr:hypothetical protein C1645_827084 [Glomus cerebriforme]
MGRSLHTATLIGTKIFFLGGALGSINRVLQPSNDFFYLDISKSFDKTNGNLPFIDLNYKALEIPPHYGSAATAFGTPKDSIFLFGGDMGNLNIPSKLAFSFNSTQLEWNTVTVFQGTIPAREMIMKAVTDNNNKIYIFGGAFGGINAQGVSGYIYNGDMNIFDATNKIWVVGEGGRYGRDGHTATFLPDTGEIIYIGGINAGTGLIDITNLEFYNTASNTWKTQPTINPPEPRYGHTAVLTNDMRIIVFGGAQANINIPVNNRYVVLDTKTFEWYHGKGDSSTRAPFRHHTATLYNDYMFIAFGFVDSINAQFSNNILIYKIGDYANFTEVDNFINEGVTTVKSTTISSTPSSTPSINESKPSNSNIGIIISVTLGSILGIIIFGFIGFITFKRYKKRTYPPIIPTP